MTYNNLMLDLETLSQQNDAAIVSIAAVKFNMENDKKDTFYLNVDPRDCHRLGMRIEQDTIDWWKKQNPEAMKAWMHDGVTLKDAMDQFVAWIGDAKNLNVWTQGIDFDLPIIRNALRLTDNKVTWKYWNQYDSRTVFNVSGFDYKNAERVGKYHNALDDCLSQISWLKQIFAKSQ